MLNLLCYQSDLISITELDEQISKISKDKFVICDFDTPKWHLEKHFQEDNVKVLEFVYKYFPSLFINTDLDYATKHSRKPNGLLWLIDNNIVSIRRYSLGIYLNLTSLDVMNYVSLDNFLHKNTIRKYKKI